MSRRARQIERDLEKKLKELEKQQAQTLPGMRPWQLYDPDAVEAFLDQFRPWKSESSPPG